MTLPRESRILAGVKLPPYIVRVSSRARRVRLVINPGEGLTVVAPAGFDLGRVEALLVQRLDWIEKHLDPAWKTSGPSAAPAQPEPPAEVRLLAVSRLVRVRYRADCRSGVRAVGLKSGPVEVLEVRGDIGDRAGVSQALRSWLMREARAELSPWLARRAGELGLEYSGIGVRLQRTRWGSCSARGVINLNAALLFLPRSMAAYVIDHELAHTCHLNHSQAYWTLLETLHPGSRQADKAMRDARAHVPSWVGRN